MTVSVSRRTALAAGSNVAGVVFGCSAPAAPVPKGEDNSSWVGKTVLPKKPDPGAAYKDPPPAVPQPIGPEGTPVEVFGSLHAAAWEVKSEKGTRVEVFEDGFAYWLERDKVVPLSDAVEFYTKALEDDEKDAYAYNFRGWAKYLLDQPDEAVKDFGAFLTLTGPDGPLAAPAHRATGLSNRGLVLAEQGKFEAALKDLDEAVKLGHAPAQLNRGLAYELRGEDKNAAADYATVIDRSSTDVLARNNMAWLRATCPNAEFRDGKEAVKIAKRVCEQTGNREGAFLDTLAAAHAETGDFAAAVKAQELALEDRGYMRKYGDDAQKRLQLYKDKKPYRSTPLK